MALPLTFYLKQEGDQWAALAPEVTVSSCGDSLDSARQALQDAVETYVLYMIQAGRRAEIPRPLSQDQITDFLADPPGRYEIEEHVLFLMLARGGAGSEPVVSEAFFVRSMLPAHAARGPLAAS
jgi:predicted RNase H-like HicB family nuclease